MVEADSHLKPLPSSNLDIYKVLEHIDMVSKGIRCSLIQLYPLYMAQILGFWVTC